MSHIGAEDRGGREFFPPPEEESSEPPLLLIPHHLSLLLLLLAFNSEDLFTEPFFCFLLDADLTKNQRKVFYLYIYLFYVLFFPSKDVQWISCTEDKRLSSRILMRSVTLRDGELYRVE